MKWKLSLFWAFALIFCCALPCFAETAASSDFVASSAVSESEVASSVPASSASVIPDPLPSASAAAPAASAPPVVVTVIVPTAEPTATPEPTYQVFGVNALKDGWEDLSYTATPGMTIGEDGQAGYLDTDSLSGYVDVSGYDKVVFTAEGVTGSRAVFYDSAKQALPDSVFLYEHGQSVDVPASAVYIRFSYPTANTVVISGEVKAVSVAASVAPTAEPTVWDKPIEDYTPTEGMLLVIVVLLMFGGVAVLVSRRVGFRG